ncbi:MAG TPA: signal peptide peptidase SppA [Thermoanaerobaculia bacterium]|nr:signal peptide peptidase SppA [Thermoanaerobaculia bacterium]
MKKSSRFGLGFVLIVAFLVLVAAVAVLAWWMGRETVSRHTILEVEIEDGLVEHVPQDPIAELLMDRKMEVREFVEALQAAADDDNVVALVARVAPVGLGTAQIEELRDAVLAFRESGKPAIAYTDTFGEVTPANAAYYLASAFDEIYIQPSGDVGLTGMAAESMFLRGTLDKIGVEPEFAQRYEYKNAMNTFTETEFTEAHRQAMQELVDSIYGQMVDEIGRARGVAPPQLRALIDRGPFLGQEAVDAGLVDGLLYRDQVYDRVRRLARGEAEVGEIQPADTQAGDATATGEDEEEDDDSDLLYLQKYWQRADKPYAKGDDTIALVYGVGAVVRGDGGFDPLTGSASMGGAAVAKALRAAIDDDDVEAIILRVDSPGGSYVASDMIWREVMRAREAGKPVIASMSNLAASGGYFVSIPADKIVAHPSTITGSIGVLGGKMVTREMWNKLGVSWDMVQAGDHAEMWSGLEPFDEDEWARFNAWLDRVYDDFTSKVAAGRDLPKERVLEIAKGRVWSGRDALRLGLVDELGGFPVAVRLAREAAGIDPGAKVRIREYPKVGSPWQELFGEGPENSEQAAVAALVRTLERVRPVARLAQEAGILEPQPGVLRMPPVTVR